MYGTSGSLENNRTNTNDSTIKTVIDAWYENNLLTNYDKYVSKTAIYCNDRSTQNNSYVIDDSFVYSGITRLYSSDAPSYKCGANTNNGLFEDTQAVEDKFSASTTGGENGQLKYPMALMTADEVTFAGGVYNLLLSSPYAWFYINSLGESLVTGTYAWWLLTPSSSAKTYTDIFDVYGSGITQSHFSLNDVRFMLAVRSALSLDSYVKIKSGNGTPESPYEIDYDNSCN